MEPANFHNGMCQIKFECLFQTFKRVRINFSNPLFAAEIHLHKTDFLGKEIKRCFAQMLHIGSSHLAPLKPEKQFLISPPISPPVGWKEAEDATLVINYDLLYAISKLGPDKQYELHAATKRCGSLLRHVQTQTKNHPDPKTGLPAHPSQLKRYPDTPPPSKKYTKSAKTTTLLIFVLGKT
uniref:Regulator of calcineurin 1 n=1 Tax=Leptobrachium leishanense TaxID=445787 RepID=A0A8C5P772_9ANUR